MNIWRMNVNVKKSFSFSQAREKANEEMEMEHIWNFRGERNIEKFHYPPLFKERLDRSRIQRNKDRRRNQKRVSCLYHNICQI